MSPEQLLVKFPNNLKDNFQIKCIRLKSNMTEMITLFVREFEQLDETQTEKRYKELKEKFK